ncbi:MAG: hypothetical protein J6K12_05380 [Clostridia bacterium]|nr:hypothetical protein [Clostridia bacterium]
MEQLKKLIQSLVNTMTVSGFEKTNAQKILSVCSEYAKGCFNKAYVTKSGSVVLAKCGKGQNRRVLAFDAHLDTVGFAVTELCEGGYIRVTNLGGIDVNILPASEVLVHGKKELRGVFSSIPPHLSRSDKLPEINEMFVDVGFESKEETKKYIDIGDPVSMYPHVTQLLNDRISATGLDDKICIAAVMHAMKLMESLQLENTDIYCYFSSGEERGGNGSYHIFHDINPCACVVLDVNFAKEKGSKQGEYGFLGEGCMISISSVTNPDFTDMCRKCASVNDIPSQTVVEMTATGTNADVLARTGVGIACAVVSVPLKYMHSSVECVSLEDVVSTSKLLRAVAMEYDSNPLGIPVYHKGGAELGL